MREVAGLRILYTPRAKVYHLLQQSTHALRDGNHEEFLSPYQANRLPGDAPPPWD